MKQLSHLNIHSGNPPLSTMPGQNRKSINTYKAFYLFSNSSPFTKSSICGVETGATRHWWLFVVQQLLWEGVSKVVRCAWWVLEAVKITELTFQDDQGSAAEQTHRRFTPRGRRNVRKTLNGPTSISLSLPRSSLKRPRSLLLHPWIQSPLGGCLLITRGPRGKAELLRGLVTQAV